jgi:DNA-3-methyladenine glycosylase II
MNFKKIHQEILKRSSKYSIIKNEIKKNGIIKIKKSKLDLFAFITKTIISQQISDKVAQSLWKKFCLFLKTEYPSKSDIIDKHQLNNVLENLGISQKKKNYIKAFYDNSKENLMNLLECQNEEKIRTSLIEFSGIGNWTCDMVLIFYLNRVNIFPTSDLIIKKTTEKLCILENKTIDFTKSFSPYLSVFSLHLWKMSKRVL